MINQPTAALVDVSVREFEKECGTDEVALAELFRSYPKNTTHAHVLLKVAAVNSIYSTRILAFKDLAKYIFEKGDQLDRSLECCDLEAFSLIERYTPSTGHERHPFSFASKYCCWQRPGCYPIYDRCVDRYISTLNRQEHLGYSSSESWNYPYFVWIMNDLRSRYGLQAYSYKQLDAFLYLQGRALLR